MCHCILKVRVYSDIYLIIYVCIYILYKNIIVLQNYNSDTVSSFAV